jgi:hypothetical protein
MRVTTSSSSATTGWSTRAAPCGLALEELRVLGPGHLGRDHPQQIAHLCLVVTALVTSRSPPLQSRRATKDQDVKTRKCH